LSVRIVGAGETAETLRAALARIGFAERTGAPGAFVCTADDLPRAIAMRELAQANGPIVVLTDDAASAIEGGADDAGSTPGEVARRVAARLKAPRFGALTGLRRNARTADTPVIFLSAQGDAETKSQGLSLGAADYLAKPFSEQELMARVDRTLKLSAQKEHYRALAQTDGLTGLPNFRSFHARLEEEVARAHRYGHHLACAMVDLDGLKQINDKLGHAAGNRAILAMADAVREELRDTDFAARYGGDEFVVLLPQTNEPQAALFAERLRRRLIGVSEEAGPPERGSIGVAAVSAEELDSAEAAEDLLRRADEALYLAKRSGRDRVEVAHVHH
jgi:diguanylate cyclase (GGDEF)-like protein